MLVKTITLTPARPEVTLSALLWEASPALQDASRPRPAFLILPGGGYESHAHREADPVAVRFSAMGYHTFVLRYSLSRKDGSCLYPQPVLDVAQAMAYIRAHADEWCLDGSRIGICGFSAGGHCALLYATCWQQPWVAQKSGTRTKFLRPALCIAGYPVVDYMRWPDEALPNAMVREVRQRCRVNLLGDRAHDSRLLAEIDPSLHVTSDTPPTFLWITSQDQKVAAANVLHMAEALMKAGTPVEVHLFEEGEHGLSLACPASAGIRRKVQPSVAPWIELCQTWVEKRFALELMDE